MLSIDKTNLLKNFNLTELVIQRYLVYALSYHNFSLQLRNQGKIVTRRGFPLAQLK